jgi:excinuclease UvrABC ATPase subunit
MAYPDYGSITIRGARENNLKNVSLDIPKRRITVFTGVSGSGKSSLVFSTIAAESQRLINETYPAFVQQFMPQYGQPDADMLENISAAIIVDQQRLGGNSRSTVATVTDTSFACRSRPSPSTCECCERLGSWYNELRRSGACID